MAINPQSEDLVDNMNTNLFNRKKAIKTILVLMALVCIVFIL